MLDAPNSVSYFATPGQIFNFAAQTGVCTALPMSFVVAHNQDGIMKQALLEPGISFDLSFVFRKGKDQIPRISNFLKEIDNYLREEDYISRLTNINKK